MTKPENIDLTLKKAGFSRAAVSIETDDGEVLSGTVEELNEHTVKLREVDGVTFIPIVEIEDVSILDAD